mmetsp:Transcript_37953/g.77654  ORF Transcript_37953/g.77654 Transcript_37953/m.77654 type:complete len:299 (+) Transcript_37953:48-944(+)
MQLSKLFLCCLVWEARGADLLCQDAEPQAPRDVSPGYIGERITRYEPYGSDQIDRFEQVNIHWHLGAEHRMENAYDRRSPEWASYVTVPDENHVSQPVVPGLWCPTDGIDDAKLDESSFSFTYCKAAQVGGTYEFHWVFSTGGPGRLQEDGDEGQLGITAGLGGAFTRTNNADVIVRAQICLIVNDPSLNDYVDAKNRTFLEQWQQPPAGSAVRYVGSTTGPSYDDEVCSPVEVNWHVDQRCCILSAQAMDNLCKDMIDAGLEADVSPKGSRRPVDRRWVSDVTFPLVPQGAGIVQQG